MRGFGCRCILDGLFVWASGCASATADCVKLSSGRSISVPGMTPNPRV